MHSCTNLFQFDYINKNTSFIQITLLSTYCFYYLFLECMFKYQQQCNILSRTKKGCIDFLDFSEINLTATYLKQVEVLNKRTLKRVIVISYIFLNRHCFNYLFAIKAHSQKHYI